MTSLSCGSLNLRLGMLLHSSENCLMLATNGSSNVLQNESTSSRINLSMTLSFRLGSILVKKEIEMLKKLLLTVEKRLVNSIPSLKYSSRSLLFFTLSLISSMGELTILLEPDNLRLSLKIEYV